MVLVGVSVAASIVTSQARQDEVLVSAASSLGEVMAEAGRAFEARARTRVVLNLGASNALARQVRAGAPVDVLVTAAEAPIAQLGPLVRGDTSVDLASNQLVVVVPDDRPAGWTSITRLARPDVRRVAVGDPAGVPAGVYAKAYLESLGLWTALQPKLVPTGSVRLALAAVESGSVDAAVVYRTDVALARRSRIAWLVPSSEGPRIRYVGVVTRDAPNARGAERFLTFLAGPEVAALLQRAGFAPPSGAR
jgi:molybdate transport system substrate-binding protein